jgi:hypothetical protein
MHVFNIISLFNTYSIMYSTSYILLSKLNYPPHQSALNMADYDNLPIRVHVPLIYSLSSHLKPAILEFMTTVAICNISPFIDS